MISTLVLRFAIPVVAVGFAALMSERGIGVFNLTAMPVWLEIILAIILLDLAVWAQHVIMHYVPPLWAFHRIHHMDEDLDVATGIRFHPGEMVSSFAIKLGAIALIGPAAVAVFLFEILLNAASIFEHANIRLPAQLEPHLRKVIVTPDMHRVHHSVYPEETNSNFGFCLSLWDRLFRTYRDQPRDGHDAMRLGLDKRPAGDPARLDYLLLAAFRSSQAARTHKGSNEA